jgi:hypothetical protein
METSLTACLLTVAVVILVPGPDMLFCLASGLGGGSRAGFLAALGAACGEVVHISASAFGLAALFAAAPPLFAGIRTLGAAYLVFLGVRAIRTREQGFEAQPRSEGTDHGAYWRGLVTNLLNPKMALFSIRFPAPVRRPRGRKRGPPVRPTRRLLRLARSRGRWHGRRVGWPKQAAFRQPAGPAQPQLGRGLGLPRARREARALGR